MRRVLTAPVVRPVVKALLHTVLAPFGLACLILRIRFFNPELLNARIGHLAYEPDFYLKTGLLGWRRRYLTIYLSPGSRAINPCLRDYWSAHLLIVRNPLVAALLAPLAWLKYLRPAYDRFPHVAARHRNQVFLAAQREYEKRFGGRPLLSLREEHRAAGRAELETLGIPRDAWFVCVHVRETGAAPGLTPEYRAHLENTGQSFRDADVRRYVPAMEHIIRAGGRVVRLGDPSMTKLPEIPGVIDYAHSPHRSDWMDIFLCAEARFFVGTTSGLFLVPFVFGVPCVLANVVPLADAPFSGRDLYVVKPHFASDGGRPLSVDEICERNLAEAYNGAAFAAQGVQVSENTADDVLDAVKEMMARLGGDAAASETDAARQRRFKDALQSHGHIATPAQLARGFLQRHDDLLNTSC